MTDIYNPWSIINYLNEKKVGTYWAMFRQMINGWFGRCRGVSNGFLRALPAGDVESMNEYMNAISFEMFSSFDTGKGTAGKSEPERFYHGFVLGLMVELSDRYVVTSNREVNA